MKILLFLFLSLLCCATEAQTSKNPAQVYLKSPEVGEGGMTTFRCHAPNAKSVLLIMDDGKNRPMQKDSTGTWNFSESLTPDIYRYTFAVDGTVMPDPNNPFIKPLFKRALGQSLAHVPGPATLSWELNDVPHGQLVQHFYKSGIVGDQRDIRVYTPPGYNPARKEPYPVLYLFHGITDETSAWSTAGRENIILDNLIAQGKAKSMIIVNTLGYGAPEMLEPGSGAYTKEALQKNEELFVASFLKEVIPMVEKLYNTKSDKKFRAVAGLSMGGGQSLDIGLNNPDLFSYVGGFSAAVILLNPDYTKAFPQLDASINKKLKLIWIAIGKDDFLIESNRKYKTWLESKNIKFSYKETDGVHSYNVWRRYLTDFSQLIFKD